MASCVNYSVCGVLCQKCEKTFVTCISVNAHMCCKQVWLLSLFANFGDVLRFPEMQCMFACRHYFSQNLGS